MKVNVSPTLTPAKPTICPETLPSAENTKMNKNKMETAAAGLFMAITRQPYKSCLKVFMVCGVFPNPTQIPKTRGFKSKINF